MVQSDLCDTDAIDNPAESRKSGNPGKRLGSNSMDAVFIVFLIFVGVAFAAAMMTFHFARGISILEQWAAENEYEIISREHRLLRLGPFWWRKSKGQEVYYVTIRTLDGQVRRGWVRCGSWFWGIFSNKAVVEWDE